LGGSKFLFSTSKTSFTLLQLSKQNFSKDGIFLTVTRGLTWQQELGFVWQQVYKAGVTFKGVFGCKEVGGSKEMGKYNCSLPYLSKQRKRKIIKPLFLFLFSSLLHNHFLTSRVLQLILWSCKSHL